MNKLLGFILAPVIGLLKSVDGNRTRRVESRGKAQVKRLDTSDKFTAAQTELMKAEGAAEGWLTRSWRPLAILALLFTVLFYVLLEPVCHAWLGTARVTLDKALLSQLIDTALILSGAYVGGRSVEKSVRTVAAAMLARGK